MSGYCDTGKRTYPTMPTRVITMEITAAKMGLSMKKCENFMSVVFFALFGLGGLGGNLYPGNGPLEPDENHVVFLGDAIEYLAVFAEELP